MLKYNRSKPFSKLAEIKFIPSSKCYAMLYESISYALIILCAIWSSYSYLISKPIAAVSTAFTLFFFSIAISSAAVKSPFYQKWNYFYIYQDKVLRILLFLKQFYDKALSKQKKMNQTLL